MIRRAGETPATTRTDAADLARALAFERAQQVRAGATSTPHPLGRLVRHAGASRATGR